MTHSTLTATATARHASRGSSAIPTRDQRVKCRPGRDVGPLLREEKKAGFVSQNSFWKGVRWYFMVKQYRVGPWTEAEYQQMLQRQAAYPVLLLNDNERQYWIYQGRFWWDSDWLTADDLRALVYDRDLKKHRQLQRAHATLQQGYAPPQMRREPIPEAVRRAVWERDGGHCVQCGSAFDIQYDHIIPFSMGGASTPENLQILCGACNRRKGASL